MEGEAELVAAITVDGWEDRLLAGQVQSGARAELPGDGCTELVAALGKATDEALRELMARLGTELAGSASVRENLE